MGWGGGGKSHDQLYIASMPAPVHLFFYAFRKGYSHARVSLIVQELCESRDGRSGLSLLTSLLVSVDVKNY